MIKRKIKEIQSLMTSDTLKEELEKKLILKKNKKNYI
jgi:DNA-binding HxlR family transcriptional regulator